LALLVKDLNRAIAAKHTALLERNLREDYLHSPDLLPAVGGRHMNWSEDTNTSRASTPFSGYHAKLQLFAHDRRFSGVDSKSYHLEALFQRPARDAWTFNFGNILNRAAKSTGGWHNRLCRIFDRSRRGAGFSPL
jgi:hypothetical protein